MPKPNNGEMKTKDKNGIVLLVLIMAFIIIGCVGGIKYLYTKDKTGLNIPEGCNVMVFVNSSRNTTDARDGKEIKALYLKCDDFNF